MKADMQTAAAMKLRGQMYRFFGRVFVLEVNSDLLKAMKAMTFPKTPENTDFHTGYAMLEDCLKVLKEDDMTDLEVDYARIFLAAGVAQGLAAFPYESVYTNKKHLMNQEASEDVTILYAAKGLSARKDMYKIPNDHVGLEFEYMARLCDDAALAAQEGAQDKLEATMLEQENFCKAHLKRWVPLFCSDVIKYAQTDFYKAIGTLCRGFIREEIDLLA